MYSWHAEQLAKLWTLLAVEVCKCRWALLKAEIQQSAFSQLWRRGPKSNPELLAAVECQSRRSCNHEHPYKLGKSLNITDTAICSWISLLSCSCHSLCLAAVGLLPWQDTL